MKYKNQAYDQSVMQWQIYLLLSADPLILQVTSYPPCVMLMAAMFSIGAAILAFLLPETVGHNLPETLGEGEAFGRFVSACAASN